MAAAEFRGNFWSFGGQNPRTFKHRGYINQNEALEPVIPKTYFHGHLRPSLPKTESFEYSISIFIAIFIRSGEDIIQQASYKTR